MRNAVIWRKRSRGTGNSQDRTGMDVRLGKARKLQRGRQKRPGHECHAVDTVVSEIV